jgi:type II secretory ATPase GspE/PulE/Tfp pilus assembly ATPase PilB-like protein
MWSSEGKPTDTEANRQQLKATPTQLAEYELEHIFQVIDSLLPFEVCLYHQILPLKLQDNQLSLGMVNPEDSSALEYINRIVLYLKVTMATQEITEEIHRTLLSKYLNHKNTSALEAKPAPKPNAEAHVVESHSTPSYLHKSPDVEKEVIETSHSQTDPPTNNIGEISTTQEAPTVLLSDLTVLQVQAPELFSPVEALINLPPKKLLEELLGRVLGGGIGRLYLERQPYKGRIIWSDNGVLQSVFSIFQGVLNELKRFAAIGLGIVAEPQQIEKECQYQNSRLLLRIRVMPGINGEEATLQVLRGAALKFYQQQQLAHLSRDVIGISQQLSYKLHDLQQRLQVNPHLKSEQSEAFSTLTRLVEKLDQQVKILTENNEE